MGSAGVFPNLAGPLRSRPVDGPPVDLYTQRIGRDGELLWGSGTRVGKVRAYQHGLLSIVPDGHGGAVFGWMTTKRSSGGLHDDFLRVQKVAPDGQLLWGDEGTLVTASKPFRPITMKTGRSAFNRRPPGPWVLSTAPTLHKGDQAIAGDGEGGAFAVWFGRRLPYPLVSSLRSAGWCRWDPVLAGACPVEIGRRLPRFRLSSRPPTGEPGEPSSIRLSRPMPTLAPPRRCCASRQTGKRVCLKMGSSVTGIAVLPNGAC